MDLPHPHQDLNDRLIAMLNDPSQSIVGTSFDRALLRELHQTVEVDEAEVSVGFPDRLIDGPAFRTRVLDVYERLAQAHKEARPELPHAHFAVEAFGKHARMVGEVGQRTIEVTSAELGGRKIEMAATPAAIEYASASYAKDLVKDLEWQVNALPKEARAQAHQDVMKALFPGAEVSALGEMRAGQFGDIRLKPEKRSLGSAMKMVGTAFAGLVTITENVAINSFIEACNIVDSMGTPPGVQGPRPMAYHRSTFLEEHLRNSKTYTAPDIMQAAMRAEVLLRGCLKHEKGVAKPELDPARVMYLESFLQRQHEMRDLLRNKELAIRKATYNEQDMIKRDWDAKIEGWKRALADDAGLHSGEDMAFARKLLGTFEREPLVGKCLTDSVLGMPIQDRLQMDFIKAATSTPAPTHDDTYQGAAA